MGVLELLKGKKSESLEQSDGLLGVIEKALIEDSWTYSRDTDNHFIIRTGVKGKNSDLRGYFLVKQESELVMFLVQVPTRTPEGKRKEVMEFITRANYVISIGNFEFDLGDGDIRFKVALDVEGGALSTVMVKNILNVAFSSVDRYFPGLMTVMYGNAIPSVAIREIEE